VRKIFGSLGCIMLLLQAGCGLLDTNKPDIVNPGDLDNPQGAEARYAGAIADFGLARDGDGDVNAGNPGTEGQVIVSGLMSDELLLSTTPPSQQEIDQRAVAFETNATIFSLYAQLHKARNAAEKALVSLQRFSPDSTDDPRIPELWSLAGFTYLYFGENFCGGVAYSTTVRSRIEYDTSRTTLETLTFAVERFDSALASPSLPIETEYLARIGKARAYLNLSRDSVTAAAALVAPIPTTFEYVTEHALSPAVLQNAVYTFSNGSLISVSNIEGGVGIPYRDDGFRVPTDSVLDANGDVVPGLDLTTPQFYELKYPNEAASIPVASGIEARLIVAEAQLVGGFYGPMTTTLNGLRAGTPLPTLATPATQAAAEDLLFAERAYWLFATGHRHGDMRRVVRQYGRAVDAVFPNGPYFKGGAYGTNVSLPIPFEANNNPRFDRSMCNPDTP
jgi:hypothetical protein